MLGDRLKELREKAGLKQTELAALLKCTVVSISRYENGQREPDLKTIRLYSETFHVSTDWILELTDHTAQKEKLPEDEQLKYYDADGNEIEADASLNRLIRLHVDAALKERLAAILPEKQPVNDRKKD